MTVLAARPPLPAIDTCRIHSLLASRAMTSREIGRSLGLSRAAAQRACDALCAAGQLKAQRRSWGNGSPVEYTPQRQPTPSAQPQLCVGGGEVRSPGSVRPAGVLAAGIASPTPPTALKPAHRG